MKTNLRFMALVLLGMMLSVNQGWGYQITFKKNSGDGSSVSTSTTCSTIVSAGSEYLSGNVATASSTSYNGGSGLKLGTKDNSGTLKMNLSTTGKVTPTSIVVRAKRYNSSYATKISVNGATAQTITGEFADYTFNITSPIEYLEIVSSKGTSGRAYAWVESITVNAASTKTAV